MNIKTHSVICSNVLTFTYKCIYLYQNEFSIDAITNLLLAQVRTQKDMNNLDRAFGNMYKLISQKLI